MRYQLYGGAPQLFLCVLLPVFKIGGLVLQRKDFGLQGFGDFWDGQNDVTLEVLNVFTHPVSLVFRRIFLF